MQLSKEEFVWWFGFILGTSGTYTILGVLGFFGWPALIPSGLVGWGLGWMFGAQFKQLQMRGKE